MEMKILFVDDEDIVDELVNYYNGEQIKGVRIEAFSENTFESGLDRVRRENFDIVVLDLCKGKASEEASQEGLNILKDIQTNTFIPVIFHSAVAFKIIDLKSLVVGVSDKKNGLEELTSEIDRIISSNLVFLKNNIHNHIEEEFKRYFWDTIHQKREIFCFDSNDVSLGYLMLRRLSNSLSKENIKQLIGDSRIAEKAMPMEFYIYPSENLEYQAGEILFKDQNYYVVLTPSCDFIEDVMVKRSRSVGKVLLAIATPLDQLQVYHDYKKNANKDNTDRLTRLIETRKGDRYFFLPATPFITNLVLDFQNKNMEDYGSLAKYDRIAKLDSPYAESMLASFIRYYNRIGFPDIDSQYVLKSL